MSGVVSGVVDRKPDSPENPHAGQGCVILDIGGDVGALVVVTPVSMVGLEVEVAPAGRSSSGGHHPHVAVVRRPVAGGELPSLVFGQLTAGRYGLAEKGTDLVRLEIEVRGGEVTTVDWPTT